MVACGLVALASSIYLIYVLEILKLRRGRLNPETGRIRGDRARQPTWPRVVARLTNWLYNAVRGPFRI